MANKRDSNSQKRSRANRAQREALKARTTAAATPRPSRAAPAASRRAPGARGPVRSTATDEATTAPGGRARRVRPPKPGDTPVDIAALEGSFLRRLSQVPGGSQVISAALVTVLATAFTCYLAIFTKTANTAGLERGDEGFVANATQVEVYGYVGLVIPMVIVCLMMVFALSRSLTPRRRRAWFFAAVIIGVIGLQAAQLHILAAGMLGYAYFKANKVEGPEPLLGGRFGRRRRDDEPVEATGSEATDD